MNFEKLTRRAIAVFTQERAALISGDLDALAAANEEKQKLLADLSAAETALAKRPDADMSARDHDQLVSLHGIIQRRMQENGRLAEANHPCHRTDW